MSRLFSSNEGEPWLFRQKDHDEVYLEWYGAGGLNSDQINTRLNRPSPARKFITNMAESEANTTAVPVKVPEPAEHAPPTLAEPASGPAAEMSGALPTDEKDGAAASAGANIQAAANGTTLAVSQSESEKPAETQTATETQTTTQDSEMKDATAPADDSVQVANGTSSDKKTPNGKRKSTGGVPEHKNKKLNKKKSMSKITQLDAKPGDYFFARLKSYPPWPSMICDEDMLPTSLLNTRPVTTKKADGTYNEAYADGGKKVVERTYPVMFLHTNEFAWIPNTDLTPLKLEDVKEFAEKGKTKSLIQAYHVAAEEHDLNYFKEMLVDHARALQEDEEAKEAKLAEKAAKADEKAAKADKKKRKSEVKAADADVDMEDADATPSAKKSSKKRKKEAESDDEEQPEKTPKTTKLKLTTNKTPATTEKKSKEPKSAKAKSEKKKKKATASDEEMPDAEDKVEEKPLDPAEEREARKKEVLFLRHKLQKCFLTRDAVPREDEMPQMNNYIKKLEAYPDLEVSIIRETKINKVLKALVKLSAIPRDEDFHFKKRSVELLGKWNSLLGAEPLDAGDQNQKGPSTNGVHDEKKYDAEESKEKSSNSAAAVEKSAEAGEKTSSEKETTASATVPAPHIELSKEDEAKNLAAATEQPLKDGHIEKAPESAEGAHEATSVVQAAE
ncbi:hypothetical protein R6Q59_009824 [Mikania micrantha]